MAVPFLACMSLVAAYYGLPPRVLPAIQRVEGGQVGLAVRNTDGSEDLGLMQVNTRWVAPIAEVTGLPAAEIRQRLIHEGCFNIAAAGAILRAALHDAGGDLMRAVGNYHSHTPHRHDAYRMKVVGAAVRLFGQSTTIFPP